MMIIEVIILALVQAITEFIPVSSSGHLIAVQEFTSINSSLGFDVILHVGTLLALIIFFWSKLLNIAKDILEKKDYRLFINLVISTIPAAIVGFFFTDILSDARQVMIVAMMLFVVGYAMVFIDKYAPKPTKEVKDLDKKSALKVGLWQVLALIPGTSRSGITMIGGRMEGLSHAESAEYSFLIAIPIIAGAAIRVMMEQETQEFISNDLTAVLVGVAVAAVSGWFAIKYLLKHLKKHDLAVFGYYRIALSLVLLLLVIF